MPARLTWRGFLRISLISIPVKVFPATESALTIGFNQLHGECQTRIRQKRWCDTCKREVEYREIVKGYEFERGRYVVVTNDDLQKVRVETTRIINRFAAVRFRSHDEHMWSSPNTGSRDQGIAAGYGPHRRSN